MTADTTTLAPCPFCGAQAHFEVDDDRWEWVECESCGMQGNRSASLMESCKPKLAEAWNRRAPAPASGELVAEVMFDERKYIQYTIPLELLPVGAKFYTAPEVRVPLTEKQISKLWSDAHNDTSDRMAHQVLVRLVETAHGITAAQKETP